MSGPLEASSSIERYRCCSQVHNSFRVTALVFWNFPSFSTESLVSQETPQS